ncbi:hypothetical protein [Candidatus Palauibacter sp.]|uniref:hypothetical protein n=1 Tax=Candidatus Palauibacter sp. TaxID=3101350 RepID=UPI003B52F032
MDREERRSAYRMVVQAFDEARSCQDRDEAESLFHLGRAGGIAFDRYLAGIEAAALFDDISDAAETRDWDQVRRIKKAILSMPRSDPDPEEHASGEDSPDWTSGYLQMGAVLGEARLAREEGDAHRDSLMAGFLVGLMGRESGWRYEHGPLGDAVLAAYDRDPERANLWVEAQEIRPRERADESPETDKRHLLLRWVGERLAAGHRFSEPLFSHSVGETEDERREREAWEGAYFEREEASIRRAQNFGRRIAGRDVKGIWIPGSYALNRALVLGSHEGDGPTADDPDA